VVGEEAIDDEGVYYDDTGGDYAGEEEAEGDGDTFVDGVRVLERPVLLGEWLVVGFDAVEEVEAGKEDSVGLKSVLVPLDLTSLYSAKGSWSHALLYLSFLGRGCGVTNNRIT
jgi:hypothetical protein